jgi:hypothetical protein
MQGEIVQKREAPVCPLSAHELSVFSLSNSRSPTVKHVTWPLAAARGEHMGSPSRGTVGCPNRQSKPPFVLTAVPDCASAAVRARNAIEQKEKATKPKHSTHREMMTVTPSHSPPIISTNWSRGGEVDRTESSRLINNKQNRTTRIQPTQAQAVERIGKP